MADKRKNQKDKNSESKASTDDRLNESQVLKDTALKESVDVVVDEGDSYDIQDTFEKTSVDDIFLEEKEDDLAFSDSKQQQPFSEDSKRAGSMMNLSYEQKRRGMFMLGGLVVLYIVYKVFFGSHGIGSKKHRITAKQAKSQNNLSQSIAGKQPKKLDTVAILHQQIFELRQQNTDNQQQMQGIESELHDVQSGLSQIKLQVAQGNSNTQSLKTEIHTLLKELSHYRTLQAASSKSKTHPVVKKVKKKPIPVHYYVRAIVPGRAWLYSSDGRVVTVKVGDRLRYYGLVETINPATGLVKTQHGKFMFGANDS